MFRFLLFLPKLNYIILKLYGHSAIQNWVKSHVTFLTLYSDSAHTHVSYVLNKYFMCYGSINSI